MRFVLCFFFAACSVSTAPVRAPSGTIVFDGNSQTAPLHGHTPYPDFVMRELGDSLLASVNVAVPGQTTIDMLARAPTMVDARKGSGVNVVVEWEGTNDLYFGATPEVAYQRLVDYAGQRRRAGWKIVILTIMPRTGINTRPDFESVRVQLNGLIRSHWHDFADQLADVALDPRFGAPLAEMDTTYFEDGTHLTQYGIEQMSHLVTPSVRALLH